MLSRVLRRLRGAIASDLTSDQRSRLLGFELLEDREVPAIVYGVTATNDLLRFDSAAPTAILSTITVSGLQSAGERVIGIDFRPRTGELFATTAPGGVTTSATLRTYTINAQTGAATFVGAIAGTVPGAGDAETGYDFNPTVDRIRVVNENDENFRINPNNGALAGDDTNLTPAGAQIIASAYDRNFDRLNAATISTTLYSISRTLSGLVIQGGINGTPSPNGGALTTIGALGVTLDANADAGFDISPSTANGGLGTAFAALTVGGVTGLYSINLTTGAATLLGNIGTGGTQLTGLTIVPDSVTVVGSGLGAAGDVRILDSVTGAIRTAVVPFAGYAGGVRVAAGDVTGDGVADAVVSAVAPQGHVKVFNGATGAEVRSFFAFVGFNGTVNVASGDVNGDGFDDIITVANGANGHVKAFSGFDGSLLSSFLAYNGFLGNVTVAAADFNLDGRAEIVTAAASNGHVRAFNSDGSILSLNGFVYSFLSNSGFNGGVFTASGDVNGDGVPDIITGAATTTGQIQAFSGKDGTRVANFLTSSVLGTAVLGGLSVADVNADGRYEIVVTPGAGTQANVFAFDTAGARVGITISAFAGFRGGATVGGMRA